MLNSKKLTHIYGENYRNMWEGDNSTANQEVKWKKDNKIQGRLILLVPNIWNVNQ